MTENITVHEVFPTDKKTLYEAWMNSQEHTLFTGGEASIDPKVGGKYMAWDEYIEGKTLELHPFNRIVQTWRSTEFEEEDVDSLIELTLEEVESGTRLTIYHTNIPEGQGERYVNGWHEHYFEPMQAYFGKD